MMHHKYFYGNLLVLFILITALSFQGCATSGVQTKNVPEKNRITLQKTGSQKGTWESPPVTYQYQIARESGKIHFSGTLTVGRTGSTGANSQYSLWVYRLNSEGAVIGKDALFSGAFAGKATQQPVDKQLDTPADTAAVAFGFNGTVRGVGTGTGSNIYNYQKTPFE
jgi:hypothetical protein